MKTMNKSTNKFDSVFISFFIIKRHTHTHKTRSTSNTPTHLQNNKINNICKNSNRPAQIQTPI